MTETSIQILHVLLWGLIATGAMSGVQFGAQGLGYSRLSLPFLIGTMFTGERRAANVAGMVFYLLGGWLFAFIYYFVFVGLGRDGWLAGALVGLAHGAILLVALLPLLPYLHPRMASEYDGPSYRRRLQPPGFLALNYGYRTPLSTLVAHAVYGAILGATLLR
ncbi:MAG TPA: hypothetical protein VF211_10330 [Burkholderiales bacterium]